ncbi:N-acetylmuramoyl-L-alanine amidase [Mucilaginibacter sp.]|uniref:N-acetylmuramoyl-L-alanine amidase family protein n=1 Tax=Mucilaginibacter sp. TaxID=1882438 RepID=UPI0028492827|nr:N-acetylmuramoyl-L-alanine amidase [Mucilaginibacter sp.]MDR3694885.1 N-acetylmuramoyl-L-alanine amidase [Mucilaginibacter sp.]
MKNKALKRLNYGLSLLLTLIPVFSFALTTHTKHDTVTTTGYKLRTIIVDPGHGGKPSGTTGNYSHGASGSYSSERNVTLALALKLQKELEKELPSVKVVLTRSNEDDVSWQRRAEIANENKGDLFISLHCNSLPDRRIRELVGHKHHKPVYHYVDVPDRSGRGVLMLVYGFHRTKEEENAIKKNLIEDDAEMDTNPDPNDPEAMILMNEYKRKYRTRSIHLAELINSEFVDTDGRHSDGIREQGVLVLCHSAMPAVLVETGFIDNPDDEAYLNSEKGQDEIVASIVRAIESYKAEVEQVSP